MPTSEWIDNFKLVLLGVPLTTICVRWIARYLRDSRIKEHKDWMDSKDGRRAIKTANDYWWKHRHDLEPTEPEEETKEQN